MDIRKFSIDVYGKRQTLLLLILSAELLQFEPYFRIGQALRSVIVPVHCDMLFSTSCMYPKPRVNFGSI